MVRPPPEWTRGNPIIHQRPLHQPGLYPDLSVLGESDFYFVPGAAMRPFGLSLSMMIKIAILLEERGDFQGSRILHRLVDDQRSRRFNTRDSV